MPAEGDNPKAESPAKKPSKDSLWKGLEVSVPGEVFYETGTEWKGVITSLPSKKNTAKKNAVYVKFNDDEKEYWFDKSKVIDWLTDKKIAEELRPTLISRKNRRSLSESESSICPDASHLTPEGAEANGDGNHLSPLEKIPESANGSLQKTPERTTKGDAGVHSHPPDKATEDDDERKVMQTPSTSVVRRFGKWMSGKFGSKRPENSDFEKEEVGPPVHAETDEEMLDNDELKRMGGIPDNGEILTPRKRDDSGWLTKMTGSFYTPFSSRKIRKRNLSPVERPRQSSDKEDEIANLSKAALKYRRAYEEGKMRFFETYPDAHPTPENIRNHFASLGSDPYIGGSPDKNLNQGYEVDDEGEDKGDARQILDEGQTMQWRPAHVVFAAVVVGAWACCAYYGSWLEEAESV